MCLNKIKLWVILILGCLILTMMGCASTKLVESWQEPSFVDKPLGKILVLGAFKNDLNRRLYEDVVIKALKKEKHPAVTGYSLMPNPSDYDETSEIRSAVDKADADAVMIAALVDVEKQERYVPPTVSYVPTIGLGYGLYDSYSVYYRAIPISGYTVTNTIVKLEITVFSVKTEKMIWAGATQSINPESRGKLMKEAADLIVKDMKKAGFL